MLRARAPIPPWWLALCAVAALAVLAGCARQGVAPPADDGDTRNATGTAETGEPPDDRELQRQTVTTIRRVGIAVLAWRTDELGAAAAGRTLRLREWPPVAPGDLEAVLVPRYLEELPRLDAWGTPFDYRVRLNEPWSDHLVLIRSAGSDRRFDGDHYETGPYDPALTENDLVWADGAFMSWPEAPGGASAAQ